jgi:hypothetical protein
MVTSYCRVSEQYDILENKKKNFGKTYQYCCMNELNSSIVVMAAILLKNVKKSWPGSLLIFCTVKLLQNLKPN